MKKTKKPSPALQVAVLQAILSPPAEPKPIETPAWCRTPVKGWAIYGMGNSTEVVEVWRYQDFTTTVEPTEESARKTLEGHRMPVSMYATREDAVMAKILSIRRRMIAELTEEGARLLALLD